VALVLTFGRLRFSRAMQRGSQRPHSHEEQIPRPLPPPDRGARMDALHDFVVLSDTGSDSEISRPFRRSELTSDQRSNLT
jgi:hypothetical protein